MGSATEKLKWILALIAVISAIRISFIARSEKNKNKWFATIFDIVDYVEVTRKKTGRIGYLFWIFLFAFLGLLTLILIGP